MRGATISARTKKFVASAFLPGYLVLWLTATACSSEIKFYLWCLDVLGLRQDGVAGVAIPGFRGDVVFGGDAGDPVFPDGEVTELSTTVFHTPVKFPAGDMTISGRFSPFGRAAERLARPKDIRFSIVHLDKKDKEIGTDHGLLKVVGTDIKELSGSGPDLIFAAKEKMRLEVRPRGADLSFAAEEVQFFFEMPNVAARAAPDAAPLRAPSFSLAGARGRKKKVMTTTFATPVNFPKGTVFLSGFVMTQGNRETRSLPTRVLLEVLHLDAKGKKIGTFKMTFAVNGLTIPFTTKPFPGFDVAAGESVRLSFKPKGGEFAVDDLFALIPVFVAD